MLRHHALILTCCATAGAQTSVTLQPPLSVFERSVYDSARQRVVAFDRTGEIWELDRSRLLRRSTSAAGPGPGPRLGAALTYDSIRHRVLLVGGLTTAALGDTWSWDGFRWQIAGSSPSSFTRFDTSMAFDAARDRVVLFGGIRTNGSLRTLMADTWEFDGTLWQQRTPATVLPAVESVRLAFDSGRAVTVMTCRSNATSIAATWEWNGADWRARSNGPTGPRRDGALVYDATRARTVAIASGEDQSSQPPGREAWEWDGSVWRLAPLLPVTLRDGSGAWFDSSMGTIVVGGGITGQRVVDLGTWSWNGSTLAPLAGNESPSSRSDPALLSDFGGGVTLFGGRTFVGIASIIHGDTWRWDGFGWHELATGVSPSPRAGASTTHQLTTGRSFLFGGATDEFWSLQGTTWTQLSNGPGSRTHCAIAESPFAAIVLFGGQIGSTIADDTWTWNGVWTPRDPLPVRPPARYQHAMAFDLARGVTVLYGGRNATGRLADTWEWDGTQWQQRLSTYFALERPSMTFDLPRSRMLLSGIAPQPFTGGLTLPTGVPSLFEYRPGAGWFSIAARPVETLTEPHAVYDWRRNTLVEYNGVNLREWTFGPPADAATLGGGCGAPAPRLAMHSRPRDGASNCGFDLSARPQQHCVFAVDWVPTSQPMGNGCVLVVGSTAALWPSLTDAAGFAELELAIPEALGLRGSTVFAQGATLDPSAPGGIALTNGLRIVVGD